MFKNLFKSGSDGVLAATEQKKEPIIDSKFIKEDINKRLGYLLEKHNINLTKESQIDVLKDQIEALKKENEPILKKISQLNNLGFSSTPTNTKVLEELKQKERSIQEKIDDISKRIREANEYNKMVAEYSLKYPGYKFVDSGTMLDIMKRYDLYLADNCFYGKEVPQEALDIISNFQSEIKVSRRGLKVVYQWGNMELVEEKKREYTPPPTASDSYIDSAYRRAIYIPDYRASLGSFDSKQALLGRYVESKLKMIAPEDHFIIPNIKLEIDNFNGFPTKEGPLLKFNKDTRCLGLNQKLAQEFHKKEKEVLDPIACLEVKGGYIVLHAWDKEAEIPEIKNPNLN